MREVEQIICKFERPGLRARKIVRGKMTVDWQSNTSLGPHPPPLPPSGAQEREKGSRRRPGQGAPGEGAGGGLGGAGGPGGAHEGGAGGVRGAVRVLLDGRHLVGRGRVGDPVRPHRSGGISG